MSLRASPCAFRLTPDYHRRNLLSIGATHSRARQETPTMTTTQTPITCACGKAATRAANGRDVCVRCWNKWADAATARDMAAKKARRVALTSAVTA